MEIDQAAPAIARTYGIEAIHVYRLELHGESTIVTPRSRGTACPYVFCAVG